MSPYRSTTLVVYEPPKKRSWFDKKLTRFRRKFLLRKHGTFRVRHPYVYCSHCKMHCHRKSLHKTMGCWYIIHNIKPPIVPPEPINILE